MTARKQILLTGATGVLGSVLAAELAPRSELTCLTRRRPVPLARVRQLSGDLTVAGMGLSRSALADLAARTDVIVHCGAMTAFTHHPETSMEVNRAGTERIVELAVAAGAHLVHVSTAFIARLPEFAQVGDEAPGQPRVRSPKSYLESKLAAEEIVLGSGVAAAIVRPSVLMGDSRTGSIQQFQGWHTMSEGVITGALPFLPAAGESLVDCVPVDFAARALAALALADQPTGAWWLTAGADAFSIDRCVDACLAVAADRGLSPHRPRLLAREMVERLVLPAFGATAPRALRRQMAEGIELMRLFGSEHEFPSRWPAELGARAATPAELAECCEASLTFLCEERGYGRGVAVA